MLDCYNIWNIDHNFKSHCMVGALRGNREDMAVNCFKMGSTIRILLFLCFVLSFSMLQMVKGEAKAGHMYVYSKVVDSCITIEKSRQTQSDCPVDHTVPSLFAQHYENGHTFINATLQMLDMNPAKPLTQQCRDDVKAIFCRQLTPRCLQNGAEIDFGDMKPLCDKVKASCPKTTGNGDEEFCDSVVSGKFKQDECVAPSKPVEGFCPQPKYKVYILDFCSD